MGINCMWRVRAKLSDPSTSTRLLAANEKRHVTWYATLDGSLGHLLPVAEKTYRRLLMLMNVMTNNLPHTAGLKAEFARKIGTSADEIMDDLAELDRNAAHF